MGLFLQIPIEVVRTWGFVIHDHAGQAVAARAGMEECLINVQHSKTLACSEGIEYAANQGIQRIIVFSRIRAECIIVLSRREILQYSVATQMKWTPDGHRLANQPNTTRTETLT
jgi:hypothetical protein